MIMVIQISRGRQSMVKVPILIFTNLNSNYLIQGVNDNILGISYQI